MKPDYIAQRYTENMSGIRVLGIDREVTEKKLKIHFSKPANGGGSIKTIYYPLLNNDAVIMFLDPGVVDTVVTVRHRIDQCSLTIQVLPHNVFVRIEARLNSEISALISATVRHQEYLKYSADLDMRFDEKNDGWVLCGNTYQVESAWQYINLVLEGQMSIHSHLMRHPSNEVSLENRHAESSHGRAAGASRRLPSSKSQTSKSKHNTDAVDPRDKKPSSGDILRKPISVKNEGHTYESLKHKSDTDSHPFVSLDGSENIRKNLRKLDIHDDTHFSMKGSSGEKVSDMVSRKENLHVTSLSLRDKDSRTSVKNLRYLSSPEDDGDHRGDILKRVERSDTSSSSDSDGDGTCIGSEQGKTGFRNKKPRTEITQAFRHADADGTFEQFSKMSMSKEAKNQASSQSNTDYPHGRGETRHLNQHEKHSLEIEGEIFKQDEHSLQEKYRPSVTQAQKQRSLKRRSRSPVGSAESDENNPGRGVGARQSREQSAVDSELEMPKNKEWGMSGQPYTFKISDLTVNVYCRDITRETSQGIVNAAIGSLINGAGVARAISEAASPKMQRKCDEYVRKNGLLATSDVIHTSAGGKFSSDVHYILHTVGPIWSEYERDRCFHELTETFLNCLIYSEKLKLKSLALPLISSGIFQVPLDVCVFSFVEALFLFSSQPKRAHLETINFVNNNAVIVLECVDYIKTILDKPHETSIALAIQRFQNFKLKRPEASGFSRQSQHDRNHLKEYVGRGSSTYSERRYSGKEKRPAERRSSSLSRAARKFESEGDSPLDKKSHDGRRSQSRTKSFSLQSNSNPKEERKTGNDLDGHGSSPVNPSVSGVTGKGTKNVFSKTSHSSVTNYQTRPKSFTSDYKGRNMPNLKQSLQTAYPREKTKKGEDRGKRSAPQPVRAFIDTADETKRKQFEDELFDANVEDSDPDYDSGQCMSLPANLNSHRSLETCPICLEAMVSPKTLSKCKHQFCEDCIEEQFRRGKPVCPCCGMVYGILKGDQPRGGKMTTEIQQGVRVPGFDSSGSIVINYDIPGGVQEAEHPNPGRSYSGIHRQAYLPNNAEGREVCRLLKKAFDARLVFTIGESRTTGCDGVITWNDIHHKTSLHGGSENFAYPDATYLSRVREELAAKGITET
ncbi:hypothetical protein ScPMuIL_001672 [Solemya velum]